jgi:succinate dehydrogenase / fumarate reductase cytochrome b subunit
VLLKAAMAVSGAAMALWLTLHMLGNLTVFAGPEVMNGYAEKVRATGLLWPVRAGLVLALVVHVLCAVLTARQSWSARPHRYHALRHRASSAAGRSMRSTGALLLAYVVFHVAQIYGVGQSAFVAGDVHRHLLRLMQVPWNLGLYLAATALVSLHLAHGLRSSLTSLGMVPGSREPLVRRTLYGWAALVTLGFAIEGLGSALGWA